MQLPIIFKMIFNASWLYYTVDSLLSFKCNTMIIMKEEQHSNRSVAINSIAQNGIYYLQWQY